MIVHRFARINMALSTYIASTTHNRRKETYIVNSQLSMDCAVRIHAQHTPGKRLGSISYNTTTVCNTWYRNSLVTRKRSDSSIIGESNGYRISHTKLSKKKAPEPGVALGLAQYSFTFEISPLYASAIRGR